VIETDILVLGSGAAGLFFALQCAKRSKLKILVITKKERSESNTNYAQGGIASVMDAHDSHDSHIRDTLIAGAGLCHEDAVRVLVEEGPDRINDLMKLGAEFTRDRFGNLDLGKEGGHSANRIVHTRDLTGKEVERSLLAAVASFPQIVLLEDHYAIELLTDHQRTDKKRKKTGAISCYGAYVLSEKSGKVEIVHARKAVMLATGGAGQVYLHTTNPEIATADGVAMGYRAGAIVGNVEFIQFHPTSLYAEGSKSFLISEAVRGAGAILLNQAGERFMSEYDPMRMELAPRDIVARAIDSELKRNGDQYVLLDLSHIPSDKVRNEFPNIYEKCLQFGIDITKQPIPVVPAAHYSCGGLVTDLVGKTNINNLYACGEVSMTGVHGANRLASNSLLESLVFSFRAADDLMTSVKTKPKKAEKIKLIEWDESGTENAEEWVVIEHDRREVQQLMWDYVGIVRSTYRLRRSERRLKLIVEEVEAYYRKTKVTVPLLELRNIAQTALLIVRSALSRKESRGLHYMTDFPNPNPKLAKVDSILQKKI
jgi:L-aspartate oxidase